MCVCWLAATAACVLPQPASAALGCVWSRSRCESTEIQARHAAKQSVSGTFPSFQYCRRHPRRTLVSAWRGEGGGRAVARPPPPPPPLHTTASSSAHGVRPSIHFGRTRSGRGRGARERPALPRSWSKSEPRSTRPKRRVWAGECIDSQTGMLPGMPGSARCVQRFDDSRNSAIHITYRISLRSSSLREPRDPLSKVVFSLVHAGGGSREGRGTHRGALLLLSPLPVISVFFMIRVDGVGG